MSQIAVSARPATVKRIAVGLVAASTMAWSGIAAGAPAPESFADLAKEVSPAVVNIASTQEVSGPEGRIPGIPFDLPEGSPFREFFEQFRDQFGDRGGPGGPGGPGGREGRRAMGLGSGFIIDPSGFVVTNNHVVDGASQITIRLSDDRVYPAEVVGTDPQTDLALLKIEAEGTLPSLQLGDSDTAEVGDWVLAVGNPFGLGGSVTAGIISARGRNIQAGPYDDFLQVDASINRGNSGGPLFDLDGNVIGVNTAIYSPTGGSIGIGFAIPSNMVQNVVTQLRETGRVERGWLGVRIQDVTPEIAEALGLEEAQGAMVADVSPDSPAEAAGLQSGDVILDFGGEDIADARALARVVAEHPADSDVTTTVWRDGSEQTVDVVTGEQPSPDRMAAAPSGESSESEAETSTLGLQLAQLTPERRARYGIPEALSGVLVLDVEQDADLQDSLRAGDLIQEVDGTEVASPQEVKRIVEETRKSDSKEAVLMLVNRNGQEIFVGVKLGVA